jgi:hypothetical protein
MFVLVVFLCVGFVFADSHVLVGDLNFDDLVNQNDYSCLSEYFSSGTKPDCFLANDNVADFNCDGVIGTDILDLSNLIEKLNNGDWADSVECLNLDYDNDGVVNLYDEDLLDVRFADFLGFGNQYRSCLGKKSLQKCEWNDNAGDVHNGYCYGNICTKEVYIPFESRSTLDAFEICEDKRHLEPCSYSYVTNYDIPVFRSERILELASSSLINLNHIIPEDVFCAERRWVSPNRYGQDFSCKERYSGPPFVRLYLEDGVCVNLEGGNVCLSRDNLNLDDFDKDEVLNSQDNCPYIFNPAQQFCHDTLLSGLDYDGDGVPFLFDCDDLEPGVNPYAVEVDDDMDNDCDGEIDEGFENYCVDQNAFNLLLQSANGVFQDPSNLISLNSNLWSAFDNRCE